MSFRFLLTALVLVSAAGAFGQNPAATSPAPVSASMKWCSDHVFEIPESALYDSLRDVIYVSNVNGVPNVVDSNGYISKVHTDGTIEQLKWVTGLHAPKGMGIRGDTLYVSDIYRVVLIDIPTGTIINSYDLRATFLNDIAIDSAGTVYISDNMADRIYSLKGGKASIWREGDLGGPNGLWPERSGLLVDAMGDGVLERIDWSAAKPRRWMKLAVGLDGLVACHGGYLVSVFDGEVYWVSPQGKATMIVNTRDRNMQAADIGFVPKLDLLLVPTFSDNRLTAYQLTFK
jgi:hypothetical protein